MGLFVIVPFLVIFCQWSVLNALVLYIVLSVLGVSRPLVGCIIAGMLSILFC